jgi:hypothetical protein
MVGDVADYGAVIAPAAAVRFPRHVISRSELRDRGYLSQEFFQPLAMAKELDEPGRRCAAHRRLGGREVTSAGVAPT